MNFKPSFLWSVPLLLALGNAQAGWDEKFYNPAPAADDVILPMPCEGFIP